MIRNYATADEDLDQIEKEAKSAAKFAKNAAWKSFNASMKPDLDAAITIMEKAVLQSSHKKVLVWS